MRFSNDDYLKAFPREASTPGTSAGVHKVTDPGDALQEEPEQEIKKDPETVSAPEVITEEVIEDGADCTE